MNWLFELIWSNSVAHTIFLVGMQDIKLNNCEKQKRWQWERIQVKLFKISVKSLALGQFQQVGSVFFNQTTNILVTFIAAQSVVTGDMTLGMMLSVTYIIGQLNSPINDIYLLISTVLSKDFTDISKIEKYHKESLNQCSKMLVTIDNILLIAKSEISKIRVLKSQIDMRPFIERILDKYRNHFFMGKTLNIETQFLSEDCKAFIDPELMENAMINLIENAIKYSYEKVTICIICSVENNHLLLRVKDDGFGISNSNMKNIFKPFNRGNKMDYRQIKGFGIGLFYVQKVVKAHKGTIEVTSEEGHGSEFYMDIPSKFL